MDDKKTFGRVRFSVSSLSLRRKSALVVLLLLVGAGIADPDFLHDADISVEVGVDGNEVDEFAELDSLLANFSEDEPNTVELETATEVDSFEHDTSSNFLVMDDQPSLLTIPSEPEPNGTPVHEVSLTTEAPLHIPADNVTQNNLSHSRTKAPTSIRLSGTIYPIH